MDRVEQAYMSERWYTLLDQAVAEHPDGCAGVAERLRRAGEVRVSRTQLSLVIAGKYPARTERLAAKVLAVLDRRSCPYLGAEVDLPHCVEVNRGPAPTWDPAALDNRRICQTCPHRPNSPSSGETP